MLMSMSSASNNKNTTTSVLPKVADAAQLTSRFPTGKLEQTLAADP
jgi:hypothetical protein